MKNQLTTYDSIHPDVQMGSSGGLRIKIIPEHSRIVSKMLQQASYFYHQDKEPGQLAHIAQQVMTKNFAVFQPELVRMLADFTQLSFPPYILLRNYLIIPDVGTTPSIKQFPTSEQWRVPAATLLGMLLLAHHHAASFADDHEGHIAQMIVPTKSTYHLHTEMVEGLFDSEVTTLGPPLSPTLVGYLCLKNSEHAVTTLLSCEMILKQLSEETLHLLMQPIYTTSSTLSSQRIIIHRNVPIIMKQNSGYFSMRYHPHQIIANSTAAQKAFDKLSAIIIKERYSEKIVMHPGDILLMNNRSCLHHYYSSILNPEKTDHWSIRMYGYNTASQPKIQRSSTRPHVMLIG